MYEPESGAWPSEHFCLKLNVRLDSRSVRSVIIDLKVVSHFQAFSGTWRVVYTQAQTQTERERDTRLNKIKSLLFCVCVYYSDCSYYQWIIHFNVYSSGHLRCTLRERFGFIWTEQDAAGKKNNNIQAPLNSQHEPPVICYETRTLLGLFGRTEGVLQNEPKDNLLLFAAD